MSLSPTKLDDLAAEAVKAARSHPIPQNAPSDALAALRRATRRKAPSRALLLAPGVLTVLAVVSFLAWPRPSEAAKLMTLLTQRVPGVARESHLEWVDGRYVPVLTVYTDGEIAKTVVAGGSERLFQQGRIITRDPRGFVEIADARPGAAFWKTSTVKSILQRSPDAHVSRSTDGAVDRYEIHGSFLDARHVRLHYEIVLETDSDGRLSWANLRTDGFHPTRIEMGYGLSPAVLEIEPAAPERTYDLQAQRQALVREISTLPASDSPKVVRVIEDENGFEVALIQAPYGILRDGSQVTVDGRISDAMAACSFNQDVSTAEGYLGQAPAELAGRHILAVLFRKADLRRLPSELRFELALPLKGERADSSPRCRDGRPLLTQEVTVRFKSSDFMRTSNVTALLSPENRAFFLEKVAPDGPTKPSH